MLVFVKIEPTLSVCRFLIIQVDANLLNCYLASDYLNWQSEMKGDSRINCSAVSLRLNVVKALCTINLMT